ncbi:MAG: hypothetical protein VXX28_07025, partial [Verrucomicrobiota bacterium]|nr:hypothetical protein [Verrucomicrobiota bacterium]
DRSKHCKRRRRGSTKKSKNHREQDSKSIKTASPDTRLSLASALRAAASAVKAGSVSRVS